ncbi:MAG: hypothetical protein ACRD1M_06795 [Terriglobales bacterium]
MTGSLVAATEARMVAAERQLAEMSRTVAQVRRENERLQRALAAGGERIHGVLVPREGTIEPRGGTYDK